MIRLAATLTAAVLVVTACAGPSFSYRDYERKAAHTAAEAASVLGSALLTVRAATGDKAPRPYLDVLFTDAESTLGDIQATFEGVQPPEAPSDELRTEVGDLLTQAGEVLATLRIEVRRGHLDALGPIAAPLGQLHTELDAFAEEHR
jgi:hypothetical protein